MITYPTETPCLTNTDEAKPQLMKRKILRKIIGPKRKQDEENRPLINMEEIKFTMT